MASKPQRRQENRACERRLAFETWPHLLHALLVLRGSTNRTCTPASRALYSMNTRSCPKLQLECRARWPLRTVIRRRMCFKSSSTSTAFVPLAMRTRRDEMLWFTKTLKTRLATGELTQAALGRLGAGGLERLPRPVRPGANALDGLAEMRVAVGRGGNRDDAEVNADKALRNQSAALPASRCSPTGRTCHPAALSRLGPWRARIGVVDTHPSGSES